MARAVWSGRRAAAFRWMLAGGSSLVIVTVCAATLLGRANAWCAALLLLAIVGIERAGARDFGRGLPVDFGWFWPGPHRGHGESARN
jgi:hypothetical protein